VALMPTTNLGYTTSAYPTLSWYIPTTAVQSAEFILQDATYKEVYRTTLALKQTGGVGTFTLTDQAGLKPLEVGKQYHWYFSLICDPDEPSANVSVEGWIQRVEPSAELTRNLQKASPEEQPSIYAEAGIWYDAVSLLFKLRQERPQDPALIQDWSDLLSAVKLDTVATAPLVPCCTPQ
jgi:hypothetical protein